MLIVHALLTTSLAAFPSTTAGAPPNDLCANAIEVPCDGTSTLTNNTNATTSPDDPLLECDAFPNFGLGTIWYRFTATDTAVFISSIGAGGLDDGGIVTLWEGSCGAFINLRCTRPEPGLPTRVAYSGLVVGQEYYIEIASALTTLLTGQRTLSVTCQPPPAPANDGCSSAVPLTLGTAELIDTFGATSDSPSCDGTSLQNDVWYSVVGTGFEIQIQAASFEIEDFTYSVYSGNCNGLECIGTSTTTFGIGLFNWCSVQGATYYIAFGSPNGDEGLGAMFIDVPNVGGTPVPCDPGDPPPVCFTVGFDTEDDFVTPLVNGGQVTDELDGLFTLTTSGMNAGPAAYDSTPGGPNGAPDTDLLVDTGNVLILQNDNNPTVLQQTIPGIYDNPNDDPDGGTLRFTFDQLVSPMSVQLIDVDNDGGTNEVVLSDLAGRTRTYLVPDDWTGDRSLAEPGMGTLDLATLAPQPGFASVATAFEDAGFEAGRVRWIEVRLAGSGAVDDLSWCRTFSSNFTVTEAAAVVRNGSGVNPETLSSWNVPDLGGTWVAGVDCSAHAPGAAALFVFQSPRDGLPTVFGELLVAGAPLFSKGALHSSVPVYFSTAIPPDTSLLGREASAQSLCTGSPGPRLSNALDLTLGY